MARKPAPRGIGRPVEYDMRPRAECRQCDWTVGPRTDAEDRALAHLQSRGHPVSVIVERRRDYDPVEET